MDNIVECKISCWDKAAQEQAELIGRVLTDGEDDVWLPFVFDMRMCFAVKPDSDKIDNAIVYISDRAFVTDIDYKIAVELFKKAHG